MKMKMKCKGCMAHYFEEEFGDMCTSTLCIKDYDYDPDSRTWTPKHKPRTDGCFQLIYCNECLAFPMGFECPNLKKIKDDKKILRKENLKDKRRADLSNIRKEIKRLRKWKSSLGVRYIYHANIRWRLKNEKR